MRYRPEGGVQDNSAAYAGIVSELAAAAKVQANLCLEITNNAEILCDGSSDSEGTVFSDNSISRDRAALSSSQENQGESSDAVSKGKSVYFTLLTAIQTYSTPNGLSVDQRIQLAQGDPAPYQDTASPSLSFAFCLGIAALLAYYQRVKLMVSVSDRDCSRLLIHWMSGDAVLSILHSRRTKVCLCVCADAPHLPFRRVYHHLLL